MIQTDVAFFLSAKHRAYNAAYLINYRVKQERGLMSIHLGLMPLIDVLPCHHRAWCLLYDIKIITLVVSGSSQEYT